MVRLILFTSKSCGVCGALKPKLEELSRELGVPLDVVDIQEEPQLSAKFLVFSAPTILVADGERELRRWSGVFSVDEVRSYLERVKEGL